MKFVGFVLKNDRTTLAGLPPPIHEGVKILKNHMYRSLADLQIEASKITQFIIIIIIINSLKVQTLYNK